MISLMASLYCSNALQPDDFIKPKYLTEWCHLRLCHLLFFGKISIIYIFTNQTPLSLEQLSRNIIVKAGLRFHWLFLSRSHSWWYISTWKHRSQFNRPDPKHAVTKPFLLLFLLLLAVQRASVWLEGCFSSGMCDYPKCVHISAIWPGILSELTKSISSSSDCPQRKKRREAELQSKEAQRLLIALEKQCWLSRKVTISTLEVCMSMSISSKEPDYLAFLQNSKRQTMHEWIFEARVYIVYNEEEEQRVQQGHRITLDSDRHCDWLWYCNHLICTTNQI